MRYTLSRHSLTTALYISRQADGELAEEATVAGPLAVDPNALTPASFTGQAYTAPLTGLLAGYLVDLNIYDTKYGVVTAPYIPTAAEYAAHFDSGDEPLGIAATAIIGG